MPVVVQRGIMFVLVCIGWVLFRAPTLSSAGHWLSAMAGGQGIFIAKPNLVRLAALTIFAMGIAMAAPNPYEIDLGKLPTWRRAVLGVATAAAVVMMNYSSKFLYFQF